MLYFLISTFIIIIDQFSKYLAITQLKPMGTYPLIDGVFHLTFAKNTGAAFSIFSNQQLFLITITSIVTLLIAFYLYKSVKEKNDLVFKLSLSFILGGAIGNLIDRIRFNYVVDFFDFRLINFAIFNIADSFIVVGTILLSIYILFFDNEFTD